MIAHLQPTAAAVKEVPGSGAPGVPEPSSRCKYIGNNAN